MKGCASEFNDLGLRVFRRDHDADRHGELVVRSRCGDSPCDQGGAPEVTFRGLRLEDDALDFDFAFDGHSISPVLFDIRTVESPGEGVIPHRALAEGPP